MADTQPTYVRQTGTTDVYNTATGKYVNYADAQAGNIWGQIKDVSNIADYGVKATNLNTLNGVNTGTGTSSANDATNQSVKVAPNGNYYSNALDSINTTIAGAQSNLDASNKANADLMAQRTTLTGQDTAALRQTEYNQYGIADKTAQLQTLTSQLQAARDTVTSIQNEENQSMLNEEGRKVSLSTIRGSQAVIQKQYDLRIASASANANSIAMQAELVQGNLSQAQKYADQVVSDITYDNKTKLDNLDFLINHNQDLINNSTADIKAGIQSARDLAQKQYDEQYQEKTAVMNLAVTYAQAGILPTDTLAQATSKAQVQAAIDQSLERQKQQAAIDASNRSNPSVNTTTVLYSVGLPQQVVTNKGKLTDSNLTNLGTAGIPPDTAQAIMDYILKGTSLETIRQDLVSKLGTEAGHKLLDTFMQTLQQNNSQSFQ